MNRLSLAGISLATLMLTLGCSSPIAPADPDPQTVHVTGQVVAYYGRTEFSPISGAALFGLIEVNGQSQSIGPIALDRNARFDLMVPRSARVRLYAGGTTANERYQPCAVTVVADRDITRDVRVVGDYDVIGAAVPPVFLEQTRILSGVVYETVSGVGRQPVPFALITINGYREWQNERGWPIANTRTDEQGRYVICGLERESTVNVYAFKFPGARDVHERVVSVEHDTVLDIDLGLDRSPDHARAIDALPALSRGRPSQ